MALKHIAAILLGLGMSCQAVQCLAQTQAQSLAQSLAQTQDRSQTLDLPSRFESLDASADGEISFAEFSDFTDALALSRTLAAQHFTRLSGGDAVITAQEWFLATQVKESRSWTRGYTLDPIDSELTDVEPADIRAYDNIPDEPVITPLTDNGEPPDEDEAG